MPDQQPTRTMKLDSGALTSFLPSRTLCAYNVATNFTWTRNTLRSPGKIGYSPSTTSSKILTAMHARFFFIGNNTLLTTKCVQLLRNHRASISLVLVLYTVSLTREIYPFPRHSWKVGIGPENFLEDSNRWANRYSTAQSQMGAVAVGVANDVIFQYIMIAIASKCRSKVGYNFLEIQRTELLWSPSGTQT